MGELETPRCLELLGPDAARMSRYSSTTMLASSSLSTSSPGIVVFAARPFSFRPCGSQRTRRTSHRRRSGLREAHSVPADGAVDSEFLAAARIAVRMSAFRTMVGQEPQVHAVSWPGFFRDASSG